MLYKNYMYNNTVRIRPQASVVHNNMVCMNTEGSKIVLCLSTEKTSYGAYEDHVSTVHMHVVHVIRGESILMYKHIHMSCPRTFFLGAHFFWCM